MEWFGVVCIGLLPGVLVFAILIVLSAVQDYRNALRRSREDTFDGLPRETLKARDAWHG